MRTVLPASLVAAGMMFSTVGSSQHDQPHPAPVEGVWCFDVVQYRSAIHVLTGDLHAGRTTLWHSRSVDGGYRWLPSVRVDTGLPAPQSSRLDDHARLGVHGEQLRAAWTTASVSSSDDGRSWHSSKNEGLSTRRDGAIVPGRSLSSLHALHHSAIEGASGLYYRSSDDGGKTWRQASRLAGMSARNSDLARAPDGMLAAVWEEVSGPESTIFYALSLDDGQIWGPPARLSDGGSEATHPRVVVTKEGYLALWLERWGKSERVLQRKPILVQHRH